MRLTSIAQDQVYNKRSRLGIRKPGSSFSSSDRLAACSWTVVFPLPSLPGGACWECPLGFIYDPLKLTTELFSIPEIVPSKTWTHFLSSSSDITLCELQEPRKYDKQKQPQREFLKFQMFDLQIWLNLSAETTIDRIFLADLSALCTSHPHSE